MLATISRYDYSESKCVKELKCSIKLETTSPTLYLPDIENSFIIFPGKIVLGSKDATYFSEVSLKNCIIDCIDLDFKADNILVKDQSEFGSIIYAAHSISVPEKCNIIILNDQALKICSPNIERNYKLRCFFFNPHSVYTGNLNYFSHLVSVICGEFRKNTARSKLLINKLYLSDKSSRKYTAFNFLVDYGCIYENGSNYVLSLKKLSELGIKWSSTAQREPTTFPEAFMKYCEWSKKQKE